MKDFIINLFNQCVGLVSAAIGLVVAVVGKLGYMGIVFLMALESSFIPFPSEVVIPPAGYLTVHGDMNLILVIFCGVLGSIIGSLFNYYLGYRFGRQAFGKLSRLKYVGRFFKEDKLLWMDGFFARHGEITTIIGRLIPMVRWYISIPAGIAKMNLFRFVLFTGIGASVWVVILAFVGRAVGNNIDLVKEHLHNIILIGIPVLIAVVAMYVFAQKKIFKKEENKVCE